MEELENPNIFFSGGGGGVNEIVSIRTEIGEGLLHQLAKFELGVG